MVFAQLYSMGRAENKVRGPSARPEIDTSVPEFMQNWRKEERGERITLEMSKSFELCHFRLEVSKSETYIT